MKLQEVTLYENKTHRILKEGYRDLTESQQRNLLRWEKELWPLLEQYTKVMEAKLTPDQIDAIFAGAEASADASGDNKNVLGKAGSAAGAALKVPVEIAKKVDAKINELGRAAKEAGPVKDMDQKFRDLKAEINANNPDNKIVQGINKVSDWAKENPTKASLAVGILTTVAAFMGGPAGGLAAGLVLRNTKELLQGADLSTAIGKSVKTAAYGAIAGWALEGIGNWLEGIRYDAVPYEAAPGLEQIDVGFEETITWGSNTIKNELGSMVVPADQVDKFKDLLDGIKEATAVTGSTTDPAAVDAFEEMWTFAKTFDKAEFLKDMALENETRQAIAAANDAFLQNLTAANNVIAAAAQGSVTASDNTKLKVGGEEVEPEQGELDLQGGSGTKNTESVDMDAAFNEFLIEKGVLDKIGAGIASGAKAIGGAAKAVGKELGSKVTKQKLVSQWKKMGEPDDVASIFNILQSAGLTDEQIAAIGKDAGVELKAAPGGDKAKDATAAEPAKDTSGSGEAGGGAADGDAPAATVKKGDVVKGKDGNEYQWQGALYTNVATGKTVGVIPALNDLGLPHPKIDPIVAFAKKDPAMAKLIKTQITAKGVKAGTKGAAQAKKAGVKGTEKAQAKGVTKLAPQPKAGIAKPGTVAAKPKPAPTAARMAPSSTTLQ